VKVGDLVRYKKLHGHVVGGEFTSKHWTGIVLEELAGKLKVLWSTGTLSNEYKTSLEIINEDR
jgi:hypothetical protein